MDVLSGAEIETEAVEISKGSPSNFRYTYAKHDPSTCMAAGLFQPILKGHRPKGVEHIAKFEKVTLSFRCFWQLGADDLRVLQGLLALASPTDTPNLLTNESSLTQHKKLRNALDLEGTTKSDLALVVQGSFYLLARELGLPVKGGKTYQILRKCIDRLSTVNVRVEQHGQSYASNLLAYTSDDTSRHITVALNPRLTAAVLGGRMEANGSHTRINLSEVRAIKGSITRILHQYLSALINLGETRTLQATTMMSQIWPGPATQRAQQKQRNRLHDAIEELRSLGWKYQRIAGNRAVIAKGHYLKYIITRPELGSHNVVDPCALRPPKEKILPFTFITDAEEAVILLKRIIKLTPRTALRNHLHEITLEQFHDIAGRQPITAMLRCLDQLSDEQIAVFLAKHTVATLRYASTRLTPQQITKAAKKEPVAVIKYGFPQLNPEQQSRIIAQFPEQMMPHFREFPEGLLEAAAIHAPFEALRFAANHLSPETLKGCMEKCPAGAIRFCFDIMDAEMRKAYLDKAPWAMLALRHHQLSQADQDSYTPHLTQMTYREFQERKGQCPEIHIYLSNLVTSHDSKWCERRRREL